MPSNFGIRIVFILDGNSEIGAHVQRELGNLICSRPFCLDLDSNCKSEIRFEINLFSFTIAQHVLSYHLNYHGNTSLDKAAQLCAKSRKIPSGKMSYIASICLFQREFYNFEYPTFSIREVEMFPFPSLFSYFSNIAGNFYKQKLIGIDINSP